MNTIALIIILMLRVVIPFSALIAVGEWIRRREHGYWLRR
jgi:hypothetical protein